MTMGNSLFANCCRHVTELIFQPRSSNSPDERAPLLPKPPASCTICPEVPEAAQCVGLYPDIIPSTVATGSLQKCTQHIQDLAKADGGSVVICAESGLGAVAGTVGPSRQAVAALPADLGADHAQSLQACESHMKLEDSSSAHGSCRREGQVTAAGGGHAAPGACATSQSHGEGQAPSRLDTALMGPSSLLSWRGTAPCLGSPGTPSSALPASVGKTSPAQRTVVPPVPASKVSPKAQDTGAGFVVTEPTACPGCDSVPQGLALPMKQQQQKKKRKKKKLTLLGAQPGTGVLPLARYCVPMPVGWGGRRVRGQEVQF